MKPPNELCFGDKPILKKKSAGTANQNNRNVIKQPGNLRPAVGFNI